MINPSNKPQFPYEAIKQNTNSKPQHRTLEFHLASKASTSFSASNIITSHKLNSTSQSNSVNKNENSNSDIHLTNSFSAPVPGLFDPQLIQPYMQWNKVSKTGPGLRNFGNTCFMNSTLQCLLYVPPLTQALLDISVSKKAFAKMNMNDDNKYISLMYQNFVNDTCQSKGTVSPLKLYQNIRRVGKQFRHQRQEDAHEYLVQLLDCIHEDILKANQLKISDGKISETTFINRIFGGYLCNELKCPKCNHSSRTYNHFQNISVDVLNGISSVKSAIQSFTQSEKLTQGNEWRCDSCKQKVCATKQLRLESLPPVLVIHLKRFSYGRGYGKINKHIRFEPSIEITYSQNLISKYELCGVIVHHGGSVHSGHYIAFVKASNGQWYEMDDERVTVRPLAHVLIQQAYILFYTAANVSKPEVTSAVATKAISSVTPAKPETSKLENLQTISEDIGQRISTKATRDIHKEISLTSVPNKPSEVPTSGTIIKSENAEIGKNLSDCIVIQPVRLKVVDSWKISSFRFVPRRDRLKFLFKPMNKAVPPLRKYLFRGTHIRYDEEDNQKNESESNGSINHSKRLEKSHSSIEPQDLELIDDRIEKPVLEEIKRYGETIRILSQTSQQESEDVQNLFHRNGKRGREVGWEGGWDDLDDTNAAETLQTAKKINKIQAMNDQKLLASRQISEWDKALDKGRQKKVKLFIPETSAKLANQANLFQEYQNLQNSGKNKF